jgi:hypothetical protein
MIRETHYATVECDVPGCIEFQEFKAPAGPLSALWLPERLEWLRKLGWDFLDGKAYCPFHIKAAREVRGSTDQQINRRTEKGGSLDGEAIPKGPGADSGLCLFEL